MRRIVVQTGADRVLNRVQDDVSAAVNPLLKSLIVDGHQIDSVTLASGTNRINHGLGRNLNGWLVVRSSSGSLFSDGQSTNPRPDLQLVLSSSAATTVSVWVY